MTSSDISDVAKIRKEQYEKIKKTQSNNTNNGTDGSNFSKATNTNITDNNKVINTSDSRIHSMKQKEVNLNNNSNISNTSKNYKKYQKLELALNIINALAVCAFAIPAFFVNFPLLSAVFIAAYFLTRILVKMAYTAKNLDKIDNDNSLSSQKNSSKSKCFLFFAISLIPEIILATIYCLAFAGILPLGIINIVIGSIILPMFLLPLIVSPIMSKICGETKECDVIVQNILWREYCNTNKLISGIFNNQIVHMVYYINNKFDRVENYLQKNVDNFKKSNIETEYRAIEVLEYFGGDVDNAIEPMSKDSQQVLAHTYCPSLLESITHVFELKKNAISK